MVFYQLICSTIDDNWLNGSVDKSLFSTDIISEGYKNHFDKTTIIDVVDDIIQTATSLKLFITEKSESQNILNSLSRKMSYYFKASYDMLGSIHTEGFQKSQFYLSLLPEVVRRELQNFKNNKISINSKNNAIQVQNEDMMGDNSSMAQMMKTMLDSHNAITNSIQKLHNEKAEVEFQLKLTKERLKDALGSSDINSSALNEDLLAVFNKQLFDRSKPLSYPNTKLTIRFMLWCAVNNPHQPYHEHPENSNFKLLKNKTLDELLASMPEKSLKAINQFLEKHPITATGHNYEAKDGITID